MKDLLDLEEAEQELSRLMIQWVEKFDPTSDELAYCLMTIGRDWIGRALKGQRNKRKQSK